MRLADGSESMPLLCISLWGEAYGVDQKDFLAPLPILTDTVKLPVRAFVRQLLPSFHFSDT